MKGFPVENRRGGVKVVTERHGIVLNLWRTIPVRFMEQMLLSNEAHPYRNRKRPFLRPAARPRSRQRRFFRNLWRRLAPRFIIGVGPNASPTHRTHGPAPMSSRISRRLFLAGAAGFAAGVPITLLAERFLLPSFSGTTKEVAKPEYAMPGPFPGRVVEVHQPDAVSPDYVVNQTAVSTMLDEGMTRLTGADART